MRLIFQIKLNINCDLVTCPAFCTLCLHGNESQLAVGCDRSDDPCDHSTLGPARTHADLSSDELWFRTLSADDLMFSDSVEQTQLVVSAKRKSSAGFDTSQRNVNCVLLLRLTAGRWKEADDSSLSCSGCAGLGFTSCLSCSFHLPRVSRSSPLHPVWVFVSVSGHGCTFASCCRDTCTPEGPPLNSTSNVKLFKYRTVSYTFKK